MDCKFVEKPFDWQAINCNYELNDVYPIIENETQILNIEERFKYTVETVRNSLAASEIFFDNEYVDESLAVATYIRRKFNNNNTTIKQDLNMSMLSASIFLPVQCQINIKEPSPVLKFNGTIRFGGVISSRIWCNGQNTIADVKRYLRIDILRSFITRIQIYCDALTDPSITKEAAFICEPPRRVYFSLSTDESMWPVQFSEYIFRGEAPTVAVAQAKQILDLDINPASIEADVEALSDDSGLGSTDSYTDTSKDQLSDEEQCGIIKKLQFVSIFIALLVLFFSMLIYFIQN